MLKNGRISGQLELDIRYIPSAGRICTSAVTVLVVYRGSSLWRNKDERPQQPIPRDIPNCESRSITYLLLKFHVFVCFFSVCRLRYICRVIIRPENLKKSSSFMQVRVKLG